MPRDDGTDGERGDGTTDRRAVLRSVGAATVTALGVAGVSTRGQAASLDAEIDAELDYPPAGEVTVAEGQFDDPEELAAARDHAAGVTVAELEAQSVDCSGSEAEDCPPPDGQCNCYFECACIDPKLYRRECCCCDDDDRNGCSGYVLVGSC